MPAQVYTIKLTDEQAAMINAACSGDSSFTEKLLSLVADGLAQRQMDWPPSAPRGGYRGRWPRAGETAALKADWRKNDQQVYRAGTTCVVECNTRHGTLVSFGDVHPQQDALNGMDMEHPGEWVNRHYSAYAFLPRGALVLSE